jgi:outer membrane receptor protein involved in Fe transport
LYNHIQGHEDFYGTGQSSLISHGSRPGEAFYGQVEHDLLDNLSLIGGFQANKIGDLKLDVVPRAGVVWNLAPRYSVKALYSQAFRAPSINENYMDYVPPPTIGGPSLKGDPNLLPEKVATVDVGLFYQGNRFEAGVDYFHSRQTNLIVLTGVTTAGRYVNLGKATFQGTELEGKYYFRKAFFVMGSASYQANEDGNGNRNITPVPNFAAKAGISYESASGLTASLFDVHEGPLHGYSQASNPKPGAYDMLNMHLRYDLSKHLHTRTPGLAFVAHAENLTNKAVWLPDWSDVPGDTIFFNRGRTVYVGIEVSLKAE